MNSCWRKQRKNIGGAGRARGGRDDGGRLEDHKNDYHLEDLCQKCIMTTLAIKIKLPKAKLQLLQNRVQIHKTTRSYMVKLFLGVGVTCGISTGK